MSSNLLLSFLSNHVLNLGWEAGLRQGRSVGLMFLVGSLLSVATLLDGCWSHPEYFHEDFIGIWRQKHSL